MVRIESVIDACIPCYDLPKIKTAINNAEITCQYADCIFQGINSGPIEADAYTRPPAGITLTKCGLRPEVGCLEATILHELTHLIGYQPEDKPNEYEKKCFKCAPNRPKY